MTTHTQSPGRTLRVITLFLTLNLILTFNSISNSIAQTTAQPSPKVAAFYQLVSGKWAKITGDAGLSMTGDQFKIAALQCHSAKSLDAAKASSISSISKTVSQQLSKILIYQKLETGLRRIDFRSRQSRLFPKLKLGKIKGGKDGFEISNSREKITIAFARIKQNNRTWPIMIESKALYLKCP